ncbi:MAG TPA: aminoglycoside phosphotransferase family protein [Aliiroseovarius sp.]|nr:aminoglycoside phosphotransferase family protein [Aliiroseovarius sp.]
MAGGARNEVWLVRGATGLFVAKSTRRCEEAVAWVAEIQALLRGAGHVVPRYVQTQDKTFTSSGLTLEPYVDGRGGNDADKAGLTALLSDLHRLTRGFRQRPGFASAQDLRSHPIGGDIDLTAMPGDLVAMCRSHWAKIPEIPPCAIHGDPGLGNVLVTPRGQVVLIDWDEARLDWPGFDLAALNPAAPGQTALLAWEVACCWQAEPDYAHALARKLRPPCDPPAPI